MFKSISNDLVSWWSLLNLQSELLALHAAGLSGSLVSEHLIECPFKSNSIIILQNPYVLNKSGMGMNTEDLHMKAALDLHVPTGAGGVIVLWYVKHPPRPFKHTYSLHTLWITRTV